MVWGYPRFQGKSGSIINARSETAGERPMFRRSLAERRCVIPTTGFFEWGPGEGGGKRKYRFNRPGTRALYLAGLWNEFAGEEKCVILTTAAARAGARRGVGAAMEAGTPRPGRHASGPRRFL